MGIQKYDTDMRSKPVQDKVHYISYTNPDSVRFVACRFESKTRSTDPEGCINEERFH